MLKLKNPLLVTFETIARAGTVLAASRELGLTQTAITQRIKSLEDGLALNLFLRSRRGMALTEEGSALLRYCKTSQELESLFIREVKGDERREVSITVSGPLSVISNRVVHSCLPLYNKYPHLRLHLHSGDQPQLVEQIRRGEVDIGIVHPSMVPNEMESKKIKPTKYVLVGPKAWEHRKLNDIIKNERIIDLSEADSSTTNYLRAFDLSRKIGRSRIFVNDKGALIETYKAGVGFGALTEAVAQLYVESGELALLNKGKAIEEELALVWYARPQYTDYFSDILKAIW